MNESLVLIEGPDPVRVHSVRLIGGEAQPLWQSPADGEGVDLLSPVELAIDSDRDRVLVSSLVLGTPGAGGGGPPDRTDYFVGAIDLTTQERTIFSGQDVGEGEAMLFPFGLALFPELERLAVGDSGRIHWIDLETGDRSILHERDSVPGFRPSRLEADPDGGRLFSFDSFDLWELEVATGAVRRVASIDALRYAGGSDIEYDAERGVAMVLVGGLLYTVDVGKRFGEVTDASWVLSGR